jgi:hypothetical protein
MCVRETPRQELSAVLGDRERACTESVVTGECFFFLDRENNKYHYTIRDGQTFLSLIRFIENIDNIYVFK